MANGGLRRAGDGPWQTLHQWVPVRSGTEPGCVPQEGLGAPTCPVVVSSSFTKEMVHVVSVIPYPSHTRAPKQLRTNTRQRELNMYHVAPFPDLWIQCNKG